MPAVTKIRHTRTGRVRVTLDDQIELDLSPAAAERHDLYTGRRLEETEVAALHDAARCEEATRAALRYLSYRPRSRLELERYLRDRGYEAAVVEAALALCVADGHVDDGGFALAFARDRIRLRPRGTWRLEAEIRQRGVEAATATAAVRQALAEEGMTERDLLEDVARRRWDHVASLDPVVARRRLVAFLRRRGFPADGIAETVRELIERSTASQDRDGGPSH